MIRKLLPILVLLSLCSCQISKISEKRQIQKVDSLLNINKPFDALLILNNLLEQNPDQGYFYNKLSLIYITQKKFDKAYQSYQKALMINPYDSEALGGIALIYFKNKNIDKSRYYLKKALKYEPESHILNYNMFRLLRAINKESESIYFIKKAILYSKYKEKIQQKYLKIYAEIK